MVYDASNLMCVVCMYMYICAGEICFPERFTVSLCFVHSALAINDGYGNVVVVVHVILMLHDCACLVKGSC